MALAAAQVVDAIAARLAGTAAGGVFTDRAWPINQAALPVWKVYATDESIEAATIASTEEHRLIVECRGIVAATVGLDDAMNDLAAAGLAAVHTGTYTSFSVQTDGISRVMGQENGADVAVVTVRLMAQFFTQAASPQAFV